MVYTQYYKLISSLNSVPQLSQEQHNRLLNIISLESRINEIEKTEKVFTNIKDLFMRKESLKKKLFELTQLDAPYRWLDDLICKSKE